MLCCLFNDTATTEIYTYGHSLSLHDALPILVHYRPPARGDQARARGFRAGISAVNDADFRAGIRRGLQEAIENVERSEEHTSEPQSLMRSSCAVFCLTKKTASTRAESQTYEPQPQILMPNPDDCLCNKTNKQITTT